MLVGLLCKFTAFSRIYQLLCSSHWLLMKMIQYISFIPSWAVHIERVAWKQNSHRIPLCFAYFMLMLSLWSAAVFCLVAWLFCRMHHTSWSHCVIPFPSAALPSEHTAADFASCSCHCLLLPCFQSKLGDPHFFQEPLQLGHVGVFNQNVVLDKINLSVHVSPLSVCLNVYMWTPLWCQPSVESSPRCYKTSFAI